MIAMLAMVGRRRTGIVVAIGAAALAVAVLLAPGAVGQQPLRVVVGQAADAADWDPPVDWNTAPEWVEENAYDCLLFRKPDDSGFEPKLATRWERVNDLTMRFHLRRDVKFHDGSPFTAEDVKFHYERIKNGTRQQYIVLDQYQFFTDIVVRDPFTVDVVTPEPNTLLLDLMSQTGCGIVSKAYFQRVSRDVMHRQPMGTGPYRLRQWIKGERVVFEANRDYWGGKPEVDEFVFRVLPEPSTRVAELLTGGIDVTYGLVQQDEPRIKANPRLRALWAPNDRGWMLYTRMKVNERYKGTPQDDRKFATEDPGVRKAIELAIDKIALRNLVAPAGEPFRARLFQPIPEANPDLWGRKANLFNPSQARETLREAGYAPGQPRLVFHAADTFPSSDLARAIKQMLERVGFTVDLRLLDSNTFNTTVYFPRRTQELILLNLGGNTKTFFGTFEFHTRQGMSASGEGWGNPRLDRLIECGWTDVRNDERRIDCYRKASELMAEGRYMIGLFQSVQLWGINQNLEYTPRLNNYIWGIDFKRKR